MLRLFTTAFTEQNPRRREEYVTCLQRNLDCSALDEICLLVEGGNVLLPSSAKIRIKSVSARPLYTDYFAWINKVASPDDVSIIANSDIWFDHTLGAGVRHLRSGECFALARWDHGQLCDRNDCQDCWIFRGRVENVSGGFSIGVPRCDNRILHELIHAGYAVRNPAFTIRCHHLHAGVRPEYPGGLLPGFVPPPYRYLWPHNLLSLPRTFLHNVTSPRQRLGYRLDGRRIRALPPVRILSRLVACVVGKERLRPVISRRLRKAINKMLKPRRLMLVERSELYEWQQSPGVLRDCRSQRIPESAAATLVPGNPRVLELAARYEAMDPSVTAPALWTQDHVTSGDMQYFRGDNAYVWQLRGRNMHVLGYALATYYTKAIDSLGLLRKLSEDGSFGIHGFTIDGQLVSRDLLDSILEIYFLEKHLGLSRLQRPRILDIGAGYGRLAHRMLEAMPNVGEYLCADAVPVSSVICDCYIRFRHIEDRARSIPLDEVDGQLQKRGVDLALNIHSFPECRVAAINWWTATLSRHRVRHLMIVPNGEDLTTNAGEDFGSVIEKHGYRLMAREPKYADPVVQKYGMNPAWHYLFELK